MCGLAGVIGRDPDAVRDAVERVTRAQAHRGPDDSGVEVHPFGDGWLGLGHRRLSIQDPSPNGRQPMAHGPTGCQIVFNGEVYNFRLLRAELEAEGERFRGGSDTEAILAGLARHGQGFVRRLQGMYAFAVFDPRAGNLLLARDPAGIKPLYVAEHGPNLVFASEVRAVLASGLVPRTVSKAGVAGLLAYGAAQQPLTMFEAVRMFPAGAWQLVRAESSGFRAESPTAWWTPPPPEPVADLATSAVHARDLLEAAVSDHLISDVPIGVFLSAGIDSTIVATLAARHSPRLRAFTVSVGDRDEEDELATATATAASIGLSHTAVKVSMSEAEEAVVSWLRTADQPSMDGLNTFVIAQAVRKQGLKVALSGLGADELFGGYPSFRDVPRLRRLARVARWLPGPARGALSLALATARGPVARAKLADLLAGPGDVASLALGRRRVLSDDQMKSLGFLPTALGLSASWLPTEAAKGLPSETDLGWQISVIESRFYQTNVLLRDTDANSMAHGLEVRVPFLDQRIMDWTHRLPGSVRFPRGQPPKTLLRRALADALDAKLLARPKTGFKLPVAQWMIGPLRSHCEAGIDRIRDSGLLEPSGVTAVWKAFLNQPTGPVWSRALTLVTLGDYLLRHAN